MECADLWGSWWSLDPIGDCQLWGVSIAWWGRIGKGLLYLAGLIAVVDIVGEQRAARRRQEALAYLTVERDEQDRRRGELRRADELANVEGRIRRGLMREHIGQDHVSFRWRGRPPKFVTFPSEVPFTEQEYATFCREVVRLPEPDTCWPGHADNYMCAERLRHVDEQLKLLLGGRWSPEQLQLIRLSNRARYRATITVGLGVVTVVLAVAALGPITYGVPRAPGWWWLVPLSMAVTNQAFGPGRPSAPARIRRLRSRLARDVVGEVPFRRLRTVALVLFCVGAFLDFLPT